MGTHKENEMEIIEIEVEERTSENDVPTWVYIKGPCVGYKQRKRISPSKNMENQERGHPKMRWNEKIDEDLRRKWNWKREETSDRKSRRKRIPRWGYWPLMKIEIKVQWKKKNKLAIATELHVIYNPVSQCSSKINTHKTNKETVVTQTYLKLQERTVLSMLAIFFGTELQTLSLQL